MIIDPIIILVIVLLLILHFYNKGFTSTNENFNIVDANILTSKDTLDILRKMLKDTHSILVAENIQYMMDGGTLLGAVRHKNIIPWDDDADIVIFEKDELKFTNLAQTFFEFGYGLTTFWGGYKLFPLNGKPIQYQNRNWNWDEVSKRVEDRERFDYKYPFIDVFIIKDFGDKFHFANKRAKTIYNKFYHMKNDVFPLKEYKFADFMLFGPNNAKEYLDRAYGNDHMTTGYKSYDHENLKFLPIVKFKVNSVTD